MLPHTCPLAIEYLMYFGKTLKGHYSIVETLIIQPNFVLNETILCSIDYFM
jgi:hypothetical protein